MIQWVVPSLDAAYRAELLASMHPSIAERTLVLDNAHANRGVAASWNLGMERAFSWHAEWLVLCSESVRFGEAGGCDLEAELTADHDSPWIDTHLGWHLVAFRTRTLARVGRFDENFFPAYMEDTDYLVRLHLAGYPSPRENDRPHRWLIGLDVSDRGTEHSIRAGLVTVDFAPLLDYYRRKWGCDPPSYAHLRPFGEEARDWTYWPIPRPSAA